MTTESPHTKQAALLLEHNLHSLRVLFLIAFVVVALATMRYVHVTPNGTDTFTYVETAKVLVGNGGEVHPERLLKPLAPLSIGLIHKVFGLSFMDAFFLEVVLGYLALAAVSLLFYRELFLKV